MSLLTRIKQGAVKIQSDPLVPETLTASEVILEFEELQITPERSMNERNPLRQSLSRIKRIPGRGSGTVTGKVELFGSGSPTTAPPHAPLFKISGHAEYEVFSIDLTGAPTGTFRPGEKITDGGTKIARFITMLDVDTMLYAQVSGTDFANGDTITGDLSGATAGPAVTENITELGRAYAPTHPEDTPVATFGVNDDGLWTELGGCRLTGRITGVAGELLYLEFTLSGVWNGTPSDQALFSGVTLPTQVPEAFLSAAIEADGDALDIANFALDLGATVVPKVSASATYGIRHYRITDRQPQVSIDPDAELEANIDFWTKYNAASKFGFFARAGSTASNRVAIAAPGGSWMQLPKGDREGQMTYEAALNLNEGTAGGEDDEYLIAFY